MDCTEQTERSCTQQLPIGPHIATVVPGRTEVLEGQLPGPGTTQIIEEAFKPGTEPGSRTTSQDGSNLEDYFEQLKRQREMQIDPQTGQPDYEGGGTVTPQPQEQSNDGDVDPDSGDPTDSEALPGFPGGRPATGRPGGLPTPSPYPTSEPTPDQSLDYGLQ